jgi:hypothetical protein
MTCMKAGGAGLCPLPIVLAKANSAISREALEPLRREQGAQGGLLLMSHMQWQWTSTTINVMMMPQLLS